MDRPVALITGANKGIGFATARELGRRDMTVLLGARDEARGDAAAATLRDEGIDSHAISLDVTSDASVVAAAARIRDEFKRLDVLINNAGVPTLTGVRKLPSETDLDDMAAVYAVNLFGPVRVTNALLPLLRQAPAARIVNVSSEVGSIASATDPHFRISTTGPNGQYASSKAALNMFTAQYAKELRDTPIKVNAANPGFVDTDFTHHRGIRTAEQGAEPIVYLATLGPDGPSGVLYGHLWLAEGADGGYGILPW